MQKNMTFPSFTRQLAAAREPGEGLSIQLGQTAANVPKKSKLSMLPQTVH